MCPWHAGAQQHISHTSGTFAVSLQSSHPFIPPLQPPIRTYQAERWLQSSERAEWLQRADDFELQEALSSAHLKYCRPHVMTDLPTLLLLSSKTLLSSEALLLIESSGGLIRFVPRMAGHYPQTFYLQPPTSNCFDGSGWMMDHSRGG